MGKATVKPAAPATGAHPARALVHTPDVVATIGKDYLDQRRQLAQSGKFVGVPLGIPSVDEFFLPLLPGELCTIQARPGNGKTGFSLRWGRWWANVLKQNRDTYPNHYVAYVTTEQTVEELNAFMAAAGTGVDIESMARGRINDEQWKRIETWSMQRTALPFVIIGQSQARRKARVPMRMDMVQDAFGYIDQALGLQCSLAIFDWLQQFKAPQQVSYASDSKAMAVADNLSIIKDTIIYLGCPGVVDVQSGRQVDKYDPPIPQQEDGQWTSGIEQDSEKMFSLVRPRKYKAEGQLFLDYVVEGHNQLFVNLLKQKMGPANIGKMLSFDPRYNQLDDMEERRVRLNPETDPME